MIALILNKKAVLSQGNRAMPQLFFSGKSSPTTFITTLRVAKLRDIAYLNDMNEILSK